MENEKEIKYFSMFTGVGGFELGIQQASISKKQIQIQRAKGCNGKTSNIKECKQPTLCNREFENTRSKYNISERWEENSTISKNLQRQRNKSSITKFSCIGFSEIDKYASELLKKRFPNTKNYGDATKINPRELQEFDMLCGGFPCQAFSIAGKRRGFQDTRGTLFFDIARILEVKRPQIVLLENVKGLLNHNKGETFRKIIQTLSELRYNVQWMVLNSKFFGVPQNRERVFIIGNLRGTSRTEILPFGGTNKETDGENKMRWYGRKVKTGEKGINPLQEAHRVYDPNGIGQTCKPNPLKIADYRNDEGLRIRKELISPCLNKRRHSETDISTMPNLIIRGRPRYDDIGVVVHSLYPRSSKTNKGGVGHLTKNDDSSYSLDTGNNQGVEIDTMEIRKLTPIECERLQGFPDNWTRGFSDTQRYKMMGNAVTVNVIKAIIEKMFNSDNNQNKLKEPIKQSVAQDRN